MYLFANISRRSAATRGPFGGIINLIYIVSSDEIGMHYFIVQSVTLSDCNEDLERLCQFDAELDYVRRVT
jgi:hypothetical protein